MGINTVEAGTPVWVAPIRQQEKVREIECMLASKPRDLGLFVFGVNSNLRVSDLVRIEVSHVLHLQPGDAFRIIEKKTGKPRRVVLNNKMHQCVQRLLEQLDTNVSGYLFQSRKGGGNTPLNTKYAGNLVKKWCKAVGLKGNYAAHTLRKTWAYTQYTVYGTELPHLMVALNHSSQRETLLYLGLEQQEIHNLFLNEV